MKTALVLACDDNFVAYASVFAHRATRLSSEKFPVVIVSDGVSDENKRLAQTFCSQISFIEARDLLGSLDFHTTSSLTRATYLRLFLDEILADFDRAVYIDSDTSPLVDISPLLRMVPKASPVMATYSLGPTIEPLYQRLPLSRKAGYLQGGLQVFDLKAVRDERIFKSAIQFALEHPEKCELVDQDALNVALQGRWQVLDWRWNVMNFEARHFPKPFYIRHHGGRSKPWSPSKSECEPSLVEQWREDLVKSPWPHKFLPKKRGEFLRNYYRPVRQAIKVRIKATISGNFEILRDGKEEQRRTERFLQRSPSILAKVEEAAREGALGVALWN